MESTEPKPSLEKSKTPKIETDDKPDDSSIKSTFADFGPPVTTPAPSSLAPPPLFGANQAADKFSGSGNALARLLSRTRAYVPEYAVLLIVTGSIIGLVNGLFSSSIDYIAEPKPHPSWGGGWQYTASLGILATTLVLIPALIVLTKRIKGTESESSDLKNTGWRKGFLGIFLVLITLTALGYAVALVYQIVSQIFGAGLVAAQKGIWKTYIKDIFAVILFGVTTWLYTRDYRYTSDDSDQKHQLLAKLHRYGLTAMAIILVIVFSMTALSSQRNDYIDNLISEDMSTIHSKVSDYESQRHRQVSSLSDLKLKDEVKGRISKYNYEYQKSGTTGYKLCAAFKTDTSTKNTSQDNTALEDALSGASADYSSNYVDPSIHDKGRVCFSYKSTAVTNYYYNDTSTDSTYFN